MTSADGSIPAPITRSRPEKPWRWPRYFFTALGLVFFAVAVFGFGPHLLAFVVGKRAMAAVTQVHGALMTGWLMTFATQGVLAASGKLGLHRRVGSLAIWLGAAIWISIVFMTIRGFFDPRYPVEDNVYYSMPQFYVIPVFGILFAAAVFLRKRPAWHKRFMAVATISLLAAAVDRFGWLPFNAPVYWPQVICLDLLLVPIVAFDLISIRRLHRATLVSGGVLLLGQLGAALLWPTDVWHRCAHWITQTFL